MVTLRDAEEVLTRLGASDLGTRKTVLATLRGWADEPLPGDVLECLLRGATRGYPMVAGTYPPDPRETLVTTTWDSAAAVAPDLVLALFHRFDAATRWAAIRLLAENGSREATQAIARLLNHRATEGDSGPFFPVLLPLERDPRHADVLAPTLLEMLARPGLDRQAASLLLAYANAGQLGESLREEAAQRVIASLGDELDDLGARIGSGPGELRWDDEDDYAERRSRAGLLLDLLGALASRAALPTLARAAQHADEWLALWGVVGLARLGLDPEPANVARVAADPESRLVLFDRLAQYDAVTRIPGEWRTQTMLAEAALVRWLAFPTELGRPPAEIELVKTYEVVDEGAPADLYAFRFRTHEPHWAAKDGWMLGVSGPFPRLDAPRTYGAMTFSRFDAYDPETLDEDVDAIAGTLSTWADAQPTRPPGILGRIRSFFGG